MIHQDVNENALYYKQRAAAFTNSVNYTKPGKTTKSRATKAEITTLLAKAAKVRSNVSPVVSKAPSKFQIINGIPHKMVNGVWVALTKKS